MKHLTLFLLLHAAIFCCVSFALDALPVTVPLSEIKSVRREKEELENYIKQARAYEKNKEYDKAISIYNDALKLQPVGKKAYTIFVSLGNACLIQKQYASAIEAYKNALNINSKKEDVRLRLAEVYEKSDLDDMAREQYLAVLQRDSKSLLANYRLGLLYLKDGFNTQASNYLNNALEIMPSDEVYRGLSRCAENTGYPDLAVKMLGDAVASFTTYEDNIRFGNLYLTLNKYKEAEDSYRKALGTNPENFEGYIRLFRTIYRREKV